MHQFQRDEVSAVYLLNNIVSFDNETPLKNMICLNLPGLP